MTQADEQTFVAFERVQKSYDGETLVVKDLNLAMPRGESLTMLGPSGSGKTTCLMMLAGFETATHGEFKLYGKPINNIPPHKRGIGMVFRTRDRDGAAHADRSGQLRRRAGLQRRSS